MSLMNGMIRKDELRQIIMELHRIAYKLVPSRARATRATKNTPKRHKNLAVRSVLTANLYISGQHYTQEYIIDAYIYSLFDSKLEENSFAHAIRGQTLLSQFLGTPARLNEDTNLMLLAAT